MITGYNTDVEHGGVVYHVQTEDKGLQNPIILSLVYAGGEILASKRSAYQDLIRNGFIEAVLAERLQRQHKLICAAIHAGRISELKNMSHREIAPAAEPAEPEKPATPPAPVKVWMPPVQRPKKVYSPRRTRIPVTPEEDPDSLKVKLIDEEEARAGDSVTLRVMVSKGLSDNQIAIKKARVSVRILGSTFRPIKASGITGKDGIAEVTFLVPQFNTGRAAMLVRAESEKEVAELRRVIQPAQRR